MSCCAKRTDGKLNVLFVSPGYKPYVGGTERIVEQLGIEYIKMPNIDRVGVLTTFMDFNFFPPKEDLSLLPNEIMDGVEVYRVRFFPRRLRYFYSLPAGLFSWKAKKVIEEFRPDIVHFLLTEWFVANAWIYLLSRKTSRHVFTIAFHELPRILRYVPLNYGNSFLGRSVDIVHVYSSHLKTRVMAQFGIPEEKVRVLPLGRNIPIQGSVSDEDKGFLTMLAVGRLSVDKGQFELVRIFNEIRASFNKNVKLVLAGGDAGERESIEKYISENGLDECVQLKGFVSQEELQALYQDADIFVLLSRVESFGLVFAEAQSHGLPIVGYGIEAVQAIFKEGAILAEPFDAEEVAQSLLEIVNNDELRNKLSREAVVFSERFSWEKVAHELVDIYQEAGKADL